MITEKNEDILKNINAGVQTVILHGCNCFHTMGAGIAKYLSEVYPQVYTSDVLQTIKGDKEKLGSYSTAVIHNNLHVLNCYTQYGFRRSHSSIAVEYWAIKKCLQKVAIQYHDWEIRMPRIGCGLAGGEWDIVKDIIQEVLIDIDVSVYYI